jgi:molecular chaperone DnaK (HSP70)
VVVVGTDYSHTFFPSTVTKLKNGNWVAGMYDDDKNYPPPGSFHVKNAKYLMGRNESDGHLKSDIELLNLGCTLGDDGEPFYEMGDEKVRPVEIAALQIRRIQILVREKTGKMPTNCVLTVPAYFTIAQRLATKEAAWLAGLMVADTLNEPTAAAVAILENEPDGRYLITDLGGGTFDNSVIKIHSTPGKPRAYDVQATSGDNTFGGQLITHVLRKLFEHIHGAAAKSLKLSEREIMTACEAAKIRSENPLRICVREDEYLIPRAAFETKLRPHWRKVENLIKQAVGDKPVQGVALTGGASLHDLFREVVREALPGVRIFREGSPADVVARGAAIMTKATRPVVTDVTSRGIGIETQRLATKKLNIMDTIIPRNTKLPARRKYIVRGVTETSRISLYEGEHKTTLKNIFLGWSEISDVEEQEIAILIDLASDAATLELYRWRKDKDMPAQPDIRLNRAKSKLTAEQVKALQDALGRRLPLSTLPSESSASKKGTALASGSSTSKKRKPTSKAAGKKKKTKR